MMGQPDLFGEIHEDEIIKIAWEAVAERGYATYRDYNDYIEEELRSLESEPANTGRAHEKILLEIKARLEAEGWTLCIERRGHGERQFYPPGQRPEENELKLIK